MHSNFKTLRAYEVAATLADDLHGEVAKWESFDLWSTGIQLMRSVDSIGANIAEGCGRWHPKDERRFLHVARGSLYETEHWISLAERRGLLPVGWLERLTE